MIRQALQHRGCLVQKKEAQRKSTSTQLGPSPQANRVETASYFPTHLYHFKPESPWIKSPRPSSSLEPLWSHQQKRRKVHHAFSFRQGTALILKTKAEWMQRTRQVRTSYHGYWTEVQADFHSSEKKVFQGSRSPHCLPTRKWWQVLLSCFPPAQSKEQLPGKLKIILILLHLQREKLSITFCLGADFRPECQHFSPVIRHLGFSLESLSQSFTQQRLIPLKPRTLNHITYKREHTLQMCLTMLGGTLWISCQPHIII